MTGYSRSTPPSSLYVQSFTRRQQLSLQTAHGHGRVVSVCAQPCLGMGRESLATDPLRRPCTWGDPVLEAVVHGGMTPLTLQNKTETMYLRPSYMEVVEPRSGDETEHDGGNSSPEDMW